LLAKEATLLISNEFTIFIENHISERVNKFLKLKEKRYEENQKEKSHFTCIFKENFIKCQKPLDIYRINLIKKIFIKNLDFNLENPNLIDKLKSFSDKMFQIYENFIMNKDSNIIKNISENIDKEIDSINLNSQLQIKVKNLTFIIQAIDNISNQIFNKLYIKINFLYLDKIENLIDENLQNIENNGLNISVYRFSVGFEYSKNYDYPLIQIPFSEISFNEKKNHVKINFPNSKNIIFKYKSELTGNFKNDLEFISSSQELDNFINEANSFLLFINFQYISTFHKVIENILNSSLFLRNSFFNNQDYSNCNPNNLKFNTPVNNEDSKMVVCENLDIPLNIYENKLHPIEFTNQINDYEINKNIVKNINSIEIKKLKSIENPLLSKDECKKNSEVDKLMKNNKEKTKSGNNIQTNSFVNDYMDDHLYKKNLNEKFDLNIKTKEIIPFKLSLSIFDLKIIYLVDYKNEYCRIFRYNCDIINKGYFGYIVRMYQIYMSYEINQKIDQLKLNSNFLTISFLNNKNFKDELFFFYDKDIKYSKFKNLKKNDEFLKFHDSIDSKLDRNFSSQNEFRNYYSTNLLYRNIFEITDLNNFKLFFELDNFQDQLNIYNDLIHLKNKNTNFSNKIDFNNNDYYSINEKKKNSKIEIYEELIFDHKHTLLKINHISFKRDKNINQNAEDVLIIFDDLKITWNKFNMDVLETILFDDVFQILDKIVLKIDSTTICGNENFNREINSKIKTNQELNATKNKIIDKNDNDISLIIESKTNKINKIPLKNNNTKDNKEINLISSLDIGRFNFVFELKKPQICIQNEIKKSKVLLSTQDRFIMVVSKICLNEDKKDMKIDLNLNSINFFISPNHMDSKYIYWIGNSDENKYYIEKNMFCEIFNTPNVNLVISQNIYKTLTEKKFELFTKIEINIDHILANFDKKSFVHFQNIFEVFIFNRGYSYADEKINIDSRDNDLKTYNYNHIRKEILKSVEPFISGNKNKQKEISFNLKNVEITLFKENKNILKILINNLEGEHIIYSDKASETIINIKDLKIMDLCDINKEIILCSNYQSNQLNSEFEDKLDLITFRRKDTFVSSNIIFLT